MLDRFLYEQIFFINPEFIFFVLEYIFNIFQTFNIIFIINFEIYKIVKNIFEFAIYQQN